MSSVDLNNQQEGTLLRHVVAFLLGLSIALVSVGFAKAVSSGTAFKIPAVHKYVGN